MTFNLSAQGLPSAIRQRNFHNYKPFLAALELLFLLIQISNKFAFDLIKKPRLSARACNCGRTRIRT